MKPRCLLPEAGIAAGGFVLAGLVAALPLEAGVGIAAALVAAVAGLVEPLIALLLLLASVPFSTLVTIEAGDFSVTAVEPLFALLLLSWLGQALRRREMRLAGGAVLAGFALIVLVTLSSSLVAARLGLTFKEVAKWLELVTVLAYVASE
ncbi:MAG: hypothetical protein IT307_13440, partial [Chloroflexi bacterium]|nr:hypothetical protein [Chloroflexota bacterium]